jgi:hypothetical protein
MAIAGVEEMTAAMASRNIGFFMCPSVEEGDTFFIKRLIVSDSSNQFGGLGVQKYCRSDRDDDQGEQQKADDEEHVARCLF